MSKFEKFALDIHGSYQLKLENTDTNRKAVITKFSDKKVWSVAFFDSVSSTTSNEDVKDYKKLGHAKIEAMNFVEPENDDEQSTDEQTLAV